MRKTKSQFLIQTLSTKYVPFRSRLTDWQLSGQHVCITFSVAEVFWVLNDRAWIRKVGPTIESLFMCNVSCINTTLILRKNHRERRTFCSFNFDVYYKLSGTAWNPELLESPYAIIIITHLKGKTKNECSPHNASILSTLKNSNPLKSKSFRGRNPTLGPGPVLMSPL